MSAPDPTYWLERTDAETARLIRQSSYYNGFTRRLLADAGITPGMTVLDVGSGAGDVALLAAELVGAGGRVIGVDVNAAGLEVARRRASGAGVANVEFIQGDARTMELAAEVDAVVGRFVLMYLADPADALRRCTRRLRVGGVVAFQDFALRLCWPPDCELWRQFSAHVHALGERAGMEMEMGYKLRRAVLDAGFPDPALRLEARVGGGPDWDGYDEAASVLRSLLPRMLALSVVGDGDVDIATYEDRLRAETVASGGVVKMPDVVSAWTRRA